MQEEKIVGSMQYTIGKFNFKLKELSLREDEQLARIVNKAFGLQQDQMDAEHRKNKDRLTTTDIPFIQTSFVADNLIITGGFLSKLLESNAAVVIADMVLELEPGSKISGFTSFFLRFKSYRLNYLSKHIKGDLKSRIFIDFFSDGTVYAANLVTHFLTLLSLRIAQMEELKVKS